MNLTIDLKFLVQIKIGFQNFKNQNFPEENSYTLHSEQHAIDMPHFLNTLNLTTKFHGLYLFYFGVIVETT